MVLQLVDERAGWKVRGLVAMLEPPAAGEKVDRWVCTMAAAKAFASVHQWAVYLDDNSAEKRASH